MSDNSVSKTNWTTIYIGGYNSSSHVRLDKLNIYVQLFRDIYTFDISLKLCYTELCYILFPLLLISNNETDLKFRKFHRYCIFSKICRILVAGNLKNLSKDEKMATVIPINIFQRIEFKIKTNMYVVSL